MDMKDVIVRSYGDENFHELLEILSDYEEVYGKTIYTNENFLKNVFDGDGLDKDRHIWVAYNPKDERLVGFAYSIISELMIDDSLEKSLICYVIVRPDFRKSNIGKNLYAKVLLRLLEDEEIGYLTTGTFIKDTDSLQVLHRWGYEELKYYILLETIDKVDLVENLFQCVSGSEIEDPVTIWKDLIYSFWGENGNLYFDSEDDFLDFIESPEFFANYLNFIKYDDEYIGFTYSKFIERTAVIDFWGIAEKFKDNIDIQETLFGYTVNSLFDEGANNIKLLLETKNYDDHKLYENIGFDIIQGTVSLIKKLR